MGEYRDRVVTLEATAVIPVRVAMGMEKTDWIGETGSELDRSLTERE